MLFWDHNTSILRFGPTTWVSSFWDWSQNLIFLMLGLVPDLDQDLRTEAIINRGYNPLHCNTTKQKVCYYYKSMHSKTDPYISPYCFGDYKVKFCQNSIAKQMLIKRQLRCKARLTNAWWLWTWRCLCCQPISSWEFQVQQDHRKGQWNQ